MALVYAPRTPTMMNGGIPMGVTSSGGAAASGAGAGGFNPMQLMSMFGGMGGQGGGQQEQGIQQMVKQMFQPDTQDYSSMDYGDIIKLAMMEKKMAGMA